MHALLALVLAATGLHGVVMRGPTMPVCIVGKPCSAPAAGAVLVFSRAGRIVGRTRTNARGRYDVTLAPGWYSVRLAQAPRIGRGLRPTEVRVPAGASRRVDFFVDTGIR